MTIIWHQVLINIYNRLLWLLATAVVSWWVLWRDRRTPWQVVSSGREVAPTNTTSQVKCRRCLKVTRHRSSLYSTFTRPPYSVSPEVLLTSYIPETKLKMAERIRKLWGRWRETSRGTLHKASSRPTFRILTLPKNTNHTYFEYDQIGHTHL